MSDDDIQKRRVEVLKSRLAVLGVPQSRIEKIELAVQAGKSTEYFGRVSGALRSILTDIEKSAAAMARKQAEERDDRNSEEVREG